MITTPTPWPDGTVPSADQFAEWLTRLTRPELVEVTGRLLSEAAAASQCFIEDHAGRIADLTAPTGQPPNNPKGTAMLHALLLHLIAARSTAWHLPVWFWHPWVNVVPAVHHP